MENVGSSAGHLAGRPKGGKPAKTPFLPKNFVVKNFFGVKIFCWRKKIFGVKKLQREKVAV